MSDEIQEGVGSQTIDYDNLTLPDPDAKQEDEQTESEEEQQTEEVTEEVNEETQEEVTEDATDSSEENETATEESERVEEVKETTNEAVEPTEVSQESNALFDVAAETEGVIQNIDELKEVSRVLGDPFFKKMYDYYKQTGDIKPFLQANSTDYSKMSDVEILRIKHQEDYKDLDLSQDVMDHLFTEEVLEKFNGREDDSLEGKVALAKLKKEANQARSAFVNTQNEFMAPTLEGQPKVDEAEMVKQRNEQRRFAADQLKSVVKDNKLSVEIAEGVDALKLDIDPSKIIDAALSPVEWLQKTVVKDGQTDWNKLSQLVAFSNNPQGFKENLYKHGNNLGQKKFVEKNLKNKPKATGRKPTNGTAGLDPYSLEAFKNSTKIN
jgi:hypothetical protein